MGLKVSFFQNKKIVHFLLFFYFKLKKEQHTFFIYGYKITVCSNLKYVSLNAIKELLYLCLHVAV